MQSAPISSETATQPPLPLLSLQSLSALPEGIVHLTLLKPLAVINHPLDSHRFRYLRRLTLGNLRATPESPALELNGFKNLSLCALEVFNFSHVILRGLGELKGLTELSLHDSSLEALPEEIWSLGHLKILTCARLALTTLSPQVENLFQLRRLTITGNPNLVDLPSNLLNLEHLQEIKCDAGHVVLLPKALAVRVKILTGADHL